ncbi:MAG: adenylate/guanylate cyclase domain-containing protein [Bacteroidota bacterium]
MKNTNFTRRLAAIMFTDIVGYTALMQESETKAAQVRARHREVFEATHQMYQGEILQYFGDGTLSIFQSGVQAVACAIALQKALQQGEKVPLRIGLHIGEIVFDGTDIYGDSVNLAARIESVGVAGAVLLSEALNNTLKNHPQISSASLGQFEFKNIANPVEVFAIQDEDLRFPQATELKGKGKPTSKTIAVLPFVNMSADSDNEYFSDGMTEEIINALAKIKGLKVISRTSSFNFKNKNIPIVEIGKALNVSTILEGSIRLAKNKMRITAQLIDVKEDFHFWSESFDRSMNDIFEVQDEISLLIADKLREHFGHFDIAEHLVVAPDVSVENYKRYLQARFLILRMSKADVEKGRSILENILEAHPKYTLAYLGIHLAYTLLGNMGYLPATTAFMQGKKYLDKAIALDENLTECQLHLAYDSFIPKWDLKAAYEHLQKSFDLRPTVEYYQSMASFLVAERKFEAAMNYIETALQIDPFHFINYHLKGYINYCDEKYETAIPFFDKALEINPSFVPSILYKGQALVLANQAQKALDLFSNHPSDEDEDLLKLGGITLAHAALKNTQQTAAGIAQLEKAMESNRMERALLKLILCQAINNHKEETLRLIEKAFSIRLSMLIYFFTDPILRSLRPNSRFQEMMELVLGKENTFRTPKRKYKKSLLDEATLRQHRQRLEQLMVNEKPYLNPDLTLRDLAALLDLPSNYTSQLLNEGFNKNFSEFVNTYRLETFKSKVAKPSNNHLTILGLAYEAGFNSKTVFNTFFKKTVGKTPKAYWKEVTQK